MNGLAGGLALSTRGAMVPGSGCVSGNVPSHWLVEPMLATNRSTDSRSLVSSDMRVSIVGPRIADTLTTSSSVVKECPLAKEREWSWASIRARPRPARRRRERRGMPADVVYWAVLSGAMSV